ncbi:hypothetical protein Taro_035046, partial [Colocasia esculenta]|nr:hypothetical protein [Colocasia esculenta]
MQGLVHAMQTQAQTIATLQAQHRAVVPARVAALTPGRDKVADKPLCTQCGKRHGGEVCWVTSGRCLRCGDKNHKIRYFPKMAQQTTAAAAPTMKDYDAILGLDWLEEHYALMDCRRKIIIFRILGKEEFVHPLPKNMS